MAILTPSTLVGVDQPTRHQARDYLRVSLDRSGRARSLDEQHTDNLRAAERNGWSLGESYRDESVSASRYAKKSRAGYDQLIADLNSGDFNADTLILWESSRGSRRVGEWVLLCDLLAEQNVHVHVTTHGRTYSPANPRDRRSLLEDAVDSEYESGKMSTRVRRTAETDAMAGKPPSRGAFGHARRYWGDDGERHVMSEEQVAHEATALRGAYERLFAGMTLVQLAQWLNEQGFRTTKGNAWHRSEVRAMLLNPRNAAIRMYRGQRIEGNWPAVVPEETWQAAVHLLTDPARKKNHGTARRWLGGSLYLCGTCEGASDMRVNYRDEGVRIYRCRNSSHNSRTADPVDAYVRTTIAARLGQPDVTELLADHEGKERAGELRAESTGLRERLDSLGVDYADGTLTGGQVRAATQRIESRLADIDSELATIGRSDQLAHLLREDDPAEAFLRADLAVQRATVDALCTVTLLPNTRCRWGLMQDTVRIDWK